MNTLYDHDGISEALALTADRIDLKDAAIVFECKKKRQSGVCRPVPVPAFLDMLNMVHDVRGAQKRRDRGKSLRLWNRSRTKGWYVVRAVVKTAKIAGPHATPKGLRHGFGIKAVACGVPFIRSSSCSGTLSYRPLPSTRMPWDRRNGNSSSGCGTE
jgi:hypothetical protein